jgi:hypothetical protein
MSRQPSQTLGDLTQGEIDEEGETGEGEVMEEVEEQEGYSTSLRRLSSRYVVQSGSAQRRPRRLLRLRG